MAQDVALEAGEAGPYKPWRPGAGAGSAARTMGGPLQRAAPTRRSRGQRGWRRPGRALTIARAGDVVSRYRGLALEKGRRREICDVLR